MRNRWLVIIGWFKACIAAFQFLTRIPAPVSLSYTGELFRRSVVFYPLVGLVIGLIVFFAGVLLDMVLPALIGGILLTALWTLLSGGLHLDGLMDTADGIMSHRTRERMLEIMKDSRVGAMGVIVCVFYVMLKAALLIYLLQEDHPTGWLHIILIPVWSRTFMVTAIVGWPYARQGQGLGALFHSVGKKDAWSAGVIAVLLSALCMVTYGGWSGAEIGVVILWMLFLTYGLGTAVAVYAARKLGGLTGDVYGALNECIELGLLMALVGYMYNFG